MILHSDGDIRKLIPLLIEAGFDCLQPLEVKASMDVIELKKQYGDIRYVFMNREDMKIDMLLCFDHVELEDSIDLDKYKNIPPPPPPPGGINKNEQEIKTPCNNKYRL